MGLDIAPYESCVLIKHEKEEETADQILEGLIKETDRLLLRKEGE